jgi:ABC-2 type transport system ATP-binding protein
MIEADELCDRVAIINHGRVLACDTPDNLKHQLQSESIFRLQVSPLNSKLDPAHLEALEGVIESTHQIDDGYDTLELILADEAVLSTVLNRLMTADVQLQNLEKNEPTLEDVFVRLVGQSMADVESSTE